jgi:xanthine/CO dehydrogenase XdhC/CoxF family maturation factor
MTHEFKHIINQGYLNQKEGGLQVLATVVDLEGSSYRKPGVRMLICDNGKMTGAVSGGCIEKEINNQAQTVFKTQVPKVITYDGRYRLGCEGLLYILIEPFYVSDTLLERFSNCIKNREPFEILSSYKKSEEESKDFGSSIQFEHENALTFRPEFDNLKQEDLSVFSQTLQPCFKLLIFGGEHDAVKLCTMASLLGWEVDIITSIKDPKSLNDFPGANSVIAQSPELYETTTDSETAVVLMNHNYVLDLKYLIKLETLKPKYIGILGSSKRREKLKNELLEYSPETPEAFLETIYSPAGLDIGSITPEEIALSILSEILAVTRQRDPKSLRNLSGKINA